MILFHGTSISVWESLSSENPLKEPYLTNNIDLAEYYAKCAMEDFDDEDYVVLCVEIEEDEYELLRADYNAFDEPISITRNGFASSDREWFEMLNSGEINYPQNDHDYNTSLKYTASVYLEKTLSADRLSVVE